MAHQPKISIIIINYNGKNFLADILSSIVGLNYPPEKLEIIVVDNGSNDGSVDLIKNQFSQVNLIQNTKNEGFAKPNNDGAKMASGEYLALLNNDMRVDKEWLNQMLIPFGPGSDSKIACVASKVLSWDGKKIDFHGSSMNILGCGFQDHFGQNADDDIVTGDSILFANGGAMLIKKDVFLTIGGFDEDYFAFYEDVDLGWRLWVLGFKVAFAKNAIAYHRHNATANKIFTPSHKNFLLYRNSLYTITKNYGSTSLNKILLISLLHNIKMEFAFLKERATNDPEKSTGEDNGFCSNSYIFLKAVYAFIDNIDKLIEKRNKIQKERKTSDLEIYNLFGNPFRVPMNDFDGWQDFIKILELSTLEPKDILVSNISDLKKKNLEIAEDEIEKRKTAERYLEGNNLRINDLEEKNRVLEAGIKSFEEKTKSLEAEIKSVEIVIKLRNKLKKSKLYPVLKYLKSLV